MKAAHIIDELKTFHKEGIEYRSQERHLTEADVERWRNACGWSRSQLFDEIAKRLALGYNASELSFDFCDMIVNDLAGPVTNTSGPKPQVFWEVYSAFDEGEYYHGNNRDEDPVEVYTRPMIAQVVESLGISPINRSTRRRVQTNNRGRLLKPFLRLRRSSGWITRHAEITTYSTKAVLNSRASSLTAI